MPFYLARGRKHTRICSIYTQKRVCSSLSTSRGAGNVLLFNSLSWYFLYISLSTSLGAGNNSIRKSSEDSTNDIATYLPREGPETNFHSLLLLKYNIVCIAPYLPREGPETHIRPTEQLQTMVEYRYLSTSRGAGNWRSIPTMLLKTCV